TDTDTKLQRKLDNCGTLDGGGDRSRRTCETVFGRRRGRECLPSRLQLGLAAFDTPWQARPNGRCQPRTGGPAEPTGSQRCDPKSHRWPAFATCCVCAAETMNLTTLWSVTLLT